ncbi:MAG: family 16 glycoside hydrolase [Pseudomonadota bacterium]
MKTKTLLHVLVTFCSTAALIFPATSLADKTEWVPLFDASEGRGSLDGWQMTGPGNFTMDEDGTIKSEGGMGLFYYAPLAFDDFELEVEWRVSSENTNSGVFVRFPSPSSPWDAVQAGYEIQIDDSQSGIHQTGGIYSFAAPSQLASNPVGEWNTFLIRVVGQNYQIKLNDQVVTEFAGSRNLRGHIGLQNHDPNSVVWFRKVRARSIKHAGPSMTDVAKAVASPQGDPIKVLTVTATHCFRHKPAINTIKALLPAISKTTEFDFHITEDVADLNSANLSKYDVLFFANATLRVDEPDEAPAAPDGSIIFRPGNFKNYRGVITLPEQEINGRLAISKDPSTGAFSGLAEFNAGPQRIEKIHMTDSQLNMDWFGGDNIGPIKTQFIKNETGYSGTLQAGDFNLPVTLTEVADAAEVKWDIANPITQSHRAAILEFLANGGGFASAHAGLDALYGWSEYRNLVGGGLFESHPWTQSVKIKVEAPDNPAVSHWGDGIEIRDEIYVLDKNPRWNSHVLASLDTQSVGIEQGPPDNSRNDFPISWLREYQGGKVFVTKLGHFPDVWTNPSFVHHLLQGMRLAAGRIPGDFSSHRTKETVAPGVWPDDLAIDPQGKVWIAELRGKVHRYDPLTQTTQFLGTVPTTDPTKIEHGLLGIELDPAFYAGEPYVYLFYTEQMSFINTLAKFRFDAVTGIDWDNPTVILRVPTDPQCCHQAGDLEWGLDGTLYVSTGDTGMSETQPTWEIPEAAVDEFESSRNLTGHHWSRIVDSERTSQNLQDLRGKILRINKDGSIPKDNPFFGQSGVRWEIYTYGLRNPYRFKVHPDTGDLYIGVVGPDARYDYDEYNISTNGGENYGWPRSIGKLFYNDLTPEDIPNYTPPLWEYTYATGARSATVGPIYSTHPDASHKLPDVFQGKLFVYDWSRRWIKWADVKQSVFTNDQKADVRNPPLRVELPAYRLTDIKDFAQLTNTTPISMELAEDGSLYVAEFDGFWDAGPNSNVSRFRWQAGEAASVEPQAHVSLGEQVYQTRCASCHQGSGEGVTGVFPPLIGTATVLGPVEHLKQIINEGVSGPLIVKGVQYTGSMPGWSNTLSEAEVSAVVEFIRSSWGNQASND